MNNHGAEFTPEQVEQQIARLTQTRQPWSDLSSDASLISELHQIYTEDDGIVENAWQRLAEQVNSADSRSLAGNATLQNRPRRDMVAERRERPQGMNINVMEKRKPNKLIRLLEICAAILVIIALVAGTTILLHNAHQRPATGSSPRGSNVAATTIPTATETPAGTILFSDPLTQNMHNLLVDDQHFFKNGAYHIADQSASGAGMVLQQKFTGPTLTYQITMQEVAGDDASVTNQFGIMLNYYVDTVNHQKVKLFYAFEILNHGAHSQYSLWKYNGSLPYPWQLIGGFINAGNEFHSGHDANVVKVVEHEAGSFTLFVNNQQVGIGRDTSPLQQPGSVGMLVSQKGTEVAFSNLLVTRP